MKREVVYTNLPDLHLVNRGKVRDIYDCGDRLIIITTDRISAFDVVMSDPIPLKGVILNKMSEFWFDKMEDIIPNHLLSTKVNDFPPECQAYHDLLEERSMLVQKAEPFPVECVVRGYLAGSGWEEYKKTGSVCGISLPSGLRESEKLPTPLFTPSTKALHGEHDENISFNRMVEIVGGESAEQLRDLSIKIYEKGSKVAEEKGIIISDVKFEFGRFHDEIILIDELLTPDSSRFWPKNEYVPGKSQKSFDKQLLRDYLTSLEWDKNPPPPKLPEDIVKKTRDRYIEIYKIFTGMSDSFLRVE